jgi:hypothetical protein
MSNKIPPTSERKRAHLQRGDRVFLPLWRMRRVRWEESVARSQATRQGFTEIQVRHSDCHCGSVDCLCVPLVLGWDARRKRWVVVNGEDRRDK